MKESLCAPLTDENMAVLWYHMRLYSALGVCFGWRDGNRLIILTSDRTGPEPSEDA